MAKVPTAWSRRPLMGDDAVVRPVRSVSAKIQTHRSSLPEPEPEVEPEVEPEPVEPEVEPEPVEPEVEPEPVEPEVEPEPVEPVRFAFLGGSISDLEDALNTGAFSHADLLEILQAENDGKARKGAVTRIEEAITKGE